jgi:hypothetical protein
MIRIAAMTALALALGASEQIELESRHLPETQLMDGSVSITGGVVALGIGFLWGHGTLNYQGQQIGFRVHGMDLGDVGAVHIRAEGPVYKLSCLDDFSGTYTAVSTGAAIAVGESAALMQNEHGVVIELESKIAGIRFNLSASRLRVTLAKHESCSDAAASAPKA